MEPIEHRDEAKEKLRGKPPLPSAISREIWNKGYLTGSRAYGKPGEDSDWDFILPPDFKYTFAELIHENSAIYLEGRYQDEDHAIIYAKIDLGKIGGAGKIVANLMLMNDSVSYRAWVLATKILKNLVEDVDEIRSGVFCNRNFRVDLFRGIRNTLLDNLRKGE